VGIVLPIEDELCSGLRNWFLSLCFISSLVSRWEFLQVSSIDIGRVSSVTTASCGPTSLVGRATLIRRGEIHVSLIWVGTEGLRKLMCQASSSGLVWSGNWFCDFLLTTHFGSIWFFLSKGRLNCRTLRKCYSGWHGFVSMSLVICNSPWLALMSR